MSLTRMIRSLSLRDLVLESSLLVLIVAFGMTAPGFLTGDNMLNVLRNVSMQGIIAFAMTLVIISGEIDLSVGSAVAFSGCLTAFLVRGLGPAGAGLPFIAAIPLAMACSLAAGFSLGLVTGVCRTRWKVPTFITTLALMTALTGAANLLTKGFPLTPYPDAFNFLGGGYIGPVPFPAVLFLMIFAIFFFVANYTAFGRAVYAIGGNAEAARLSGIRVSLIKAIVMGIASLCSFLAGILVSSQIMSGTPTAARGWELDVISAVIIGGVSMQGGSGSIAKTFIGVVFLGIIVNGMTLLNVNEYWQYVVKGGLILGAVLMNQIQLGRERN